VRIADFLQLIDRGVTPDKAKLHLATWNGEEDPFAVYLAGRFDEWQRWQRRRNFERPFVISLVSLPTANRWLYVGVHNSEGCEWLADRNLYYYKLLERPSCSEFNGRLVAAFTRPSRQSYLNAENWADQIHVAELLRERISIGEFPGFRAVNLSKAELDLIVAQGLESWRTALSNVAGVYLISDTASGKLYVGSASGEGGIWQRWCNYSETCHGGNVELKRALDGDGLQRASALRFSVLEIADVHVSVEDILQRESHWKTVLLTRDHALNAN
jgi:hypothetical protein